MPSHAAETRSPVRTGVLDILPLAVPAVPFGLVLGLAIVDSPIDNFLGWATSWIVFAGAAQLVLVTLIGGPVIGAVTAALVVNSRHFMYSVAMAETFRHQPRWFRWLGPYTLIDQIFAISTTRLDNDPDWFRHYYLAASAVVWLLWQISVTIGILVGGTVPDAWRLEFAIPVLFATLLVLGLHRRPAIVAAAVGFLAAAVSAPLPNRVSILIGALAGVAAATVIETWELTE